MTAHNKSKSVSLDALEELARKPSEESRATLIEGLTDHFLDEENAQSQTVRELFSEVVCRLLDQVAVETRAEVSARVAPLGDIPAEVIKQLAADTIEVAAAVLEKSPVLTDSDLIALAQNMVADHRVAISKREALGPRLTANLVQNSEAEVIQELAGNAGARFSETTYRALAEKAKTDVDLLDKLVDRPDLSPLVTVQITPFMTDEMKARHKKSGADEGGKSLLDSLSDVASEAKPKKSAANDAAQIDALIKRIKDDEVDLSDTLADLADQENFPGVVRVLADIADLPAKSIRAMLLNINGGPISIICKALGLSQGAFDAISHMRCEEMKMPHGDLITQTDGYAELAESEARKALSALRARNEKTDGANAA